MELNPRNDQRHTHCAVPATRQRQSNWRLWCGVSLLIWGVCATLGWTEEALPPGTRGALLLTGNRVIEGRLTAQGDTYAVEQAVGTVIISRAQVQFVGIDLHSIYVHLQDSLPIKPTADDHVDLARWCIGYKLVSEARFELQAGLETDPSREDIRRNLNKLDTLLKRPPPEPERAKPETPAQRFARTLSNVGTDVETLGGLPREAGQDFTRRIQPILMHNCTASACHGRLANTEFKLEPVRSGSITSRSTTERNLLAVMEYVEQDNIRASKIWKLLKTNHGARGQSIFLGTKGRSQLTAVQNWLLSLATAGGDNPALEATTTQASPWKVEQASHTTEQQPRWRKGAPRTTPQTEEAPAPEVQLATQKRGTETSLKRPVLSRKTPAQRRTPAAVADVEPIIAETRPTEESDVPRDDPFNPDEFNSRQRIKRRIDQ